MQLSHKDYIDKVNGCWLGKNIGGTLGAPMEWYRQVNDVSFYQQDLHGEPVPNDDLDLQLVWLAALENHGIDIDAHVLADYWLLYVGPHYSEYGTGKANLRRGLMPGLSGTVDNDFKDSCGAFIRSEIWACMCPAMPALAARYAYEDAIVDHGHGEGTHAAVMIAAMQSAAFVVNDLRRLIDIGLSYIPTGCGVAKAVRMTMNLVDAGGDWRTIRDEILKHHRGLAFMGDRSRISDEDFAKGFFDGPKGYDAPSNIAIVVLGLMLCGDDFGRMLCTTVNCGEDTDCTAATAGAIWGIMHGAGAIDRRWVEPIGTGISTLCVNRGEIFPPVPADIDELTERVDRLARQVALRHNLQCPSDASVVRADVDVEKLMGDGPVCVESDDMAGAAFRYPLFTVRTYYPSGPFVNADGPTSVRVTIENHSRAPATLEVRWHCPEGWSADPGAMSAICQQGNYSELTEMRFELSSSSQVQASNRFVLEILPINRACMMEIPITLIRPRQR